MISGILDLNIWDGKYRPFKVNGTMVLVVENKLAEVYNERKACPKLPRPLGQLQTLKNL